MKRDMASAILAMPINIILQHTEPCTKAPSSASLRIHTLVLQHIALAGELYRTAAAHCAA